MDIFEGIDFNSNMADLVVLQLKTGRYSKPRDELPGSWLKRAWEAISPDGKQRLSEAIHQALLNESSQVRAEALVLLEVSTPMVNPSKLLEVAQNHFTLFEGLRHAYDPPQANRARDLVRMVATLAQGQEATTFRQNMVMHPEYGSAVLVGLVRYDVEWLMEHLTNVVNPTIDPQWKRIDILVYNLRDNFNHLENLVKTIVTKYAESRPVLAQAIHQNVRDAHYKTRLMTLLT